MVYKLRQKHRAEKTVMGNIDASGISYAGFWKRFAANILDTLITGVFGFVIGMVLSLVLLILGVAPTVFVDPAFEYGMNGLGFVIGAFYFAVMECSKCQGTLGKMALGIKVTDLEGNQVGFGKALGRYFGKIVSGIIFGIGFLMVAFTKRKQGLHDSMSGCLVVNK